MTRTKFKVGDRVIYTGIDSKLKEGYTGTIVNIWDYDQVLGIDWDKDVDGHTCEGKAKHNHGWNIHASEAKLDLTNCKYSAIIRKSKQLNERFENRKKGTEYAF